jgi:two-component system, NtrC family, response regulator AtoC
VDVPVPLPSILVVDPDPGLVSAVEEMLDGAAAVSAAASLQQGLSNLRERQWAAVLLSLDLPTVDLAFAERLLASEPRAGAVVLLAEQVSMQMIVQASRIGVLAVLTSPPDPAELRNTLHEVLSAAEEEVVAIDPAVTDADEDAAIGASPAMLSVFRMVGRVAASPATVLILGESGTGKELFARAIHRNSDRAEGPFVAINCAAIPENLLESELFGHEKGAFTGAIARKVGRFERANRGTLMLDEIGDMSLALQSKILRALQEREIERVGAEDRIPVDVRIVAATNKDLRSAIAEGTFREDLYFRLAVVTLQLPRLHDRGSDVEMLTRHFVARYAAYYGRSLRGISRAAMERLREHQWPGNVRELKNVIERAVLLSHGPVLLPEHLPGDLLEQPSSSVVVHSAPLAGYAPDLPLAEVERLHIQEVLKRVDGHLGRAAEVLGIHRNTLTRKLQEYERASGMPSFAGLALQ